jgi:hypothetical protein
VKQREEERRTIKENEAATFPGTPDTFIIVNLCKYHESVPK